MPSLEECTASHCVAASFDSLSLDGPGCLGVLCLELLFCIGAELAWHSENTQQICMHVYSCDLNLFMLPISL